VKTTNAGKVLLLAENAAVAAGSRSIFVNDQFPPWWPCMVTVAVMEKWLRM